MSVLGSKSSLRSAVFFQRIASSKAHVIATSPLSFQTVDKCDLGLYHWEGGLVNKIFAYFECEISEHNAGAWHRKAFRFRRLAVSRMAIRVRRQEKMDGRIDNAV
jgi:hypothetical protein